MKRISQILMGILILSLWSCNSPEQSKEASNREGVIHYDIKYLDDPNEFAIITFLPNTMTYTFKENKSVQKVEGWGGVFRMIGIADSESGKVVALMKIIADKYMRKSKITENSIGYDPIDSLSITYTGDTKNIAGYSCKEAVAEADGQKYTLYFTDEIHIKNPNWNTPFKNIDGVLLEYQIKLFGINTRITATKVEKIPIEDNAFDVPEGYALVPMDTIRNTVKKYM